MNHDPIHSTYRTNAKLTIPLPALLFFVAFVLQISRTVYLDANQILGSRTDLMGFVAMSLFMLPRILSKDVLSRLRMLAVASIILFLFYMLICVSAAEKEVLPVFLSRHGLIPWLLVGFMASIATGDVIQYISSSSWKISIGMIVTPFVLLLPAYVLREAASGMIKTLSYQQVASSLTILMLCVANLLTYLWKFAKQHGRTDLIVISSVIYFTFSFVLTYLAAKLQSTSIVLVFFALAGVVAIALMRYSSVKKWVAIFFLIGLVGLIFLPDIFADLQRTTRFSSVSRGNWMISSISSRLSLLQLFWDQWNSSPISGDYAIEESIGGIGNYIHSLPFSLLTHTGIIGFSLFSIATYLASLDHYGNFRPALPVVVVLVVSTASTFFTWTPVWFILGSVVLFLPEI